jgi:uncharacterized protein (DUF1330 family)
VQADFDSRSAAGRPRWAQVDPQAKFGCSHRQSPLHSGHSREDAIPTDQHSAIQFGHILLQEATIMATYLVNHLRIPGDVPNEAGLSYLEQVEATVVPFGGRWLAQGQGDIVEGAWPGSVVLMEFPNREAADAWYNSPAYQAIRPLRTKNAISDIILIDSMPEGFTIKAFAEGIRNAVKPA